MKQKGYIFLILFIVGFSACQKNKFDVDISNIKADIQINRLDNDLFKLDVQNIKTGLPAIADKYGRFWQLYNYEILRLGNPQDSLYPLYLKKFLSDKTIREVHAEVAKKYSDLDFLKKDLNQAFRYYKYYFPKQDEPKFYTYISGFNQSVVSDSATIGISLDKYLGADCRFYEYLEVPRYLRKRLIPEKIVCDVMEAYAKMEFSDEMMNKNLLDYMILEGKTQYFLSAVLPFVSDTLKLNYTQDQLKWATQNEEAMWTYLIEKKLLFDNKQILIRNMTGEAPFTKAFGKKSAPRAASFIGKRIVEAYMKSHPKVSLSDLMKQKDAQLILQQSQYNP